MALRFANKIHSIVNNVVLRSALPPPPAVAQAAQGFKVQVTLDTSLPGAKTAPKTRYPLNQQDANSYIEQLKTRAFIANMADASDPEGVRTFNVNVGPRETRAGVSGLGGPKWGSCGQRLFAQKAGKGKGKGKGKDKDKDGKKMCFSDGKPKKKQCKKGGAVDAEKCPKLKKDDDGCPKFKIENCEVSKMFLCHKRPFVFKDCKKRPAPYPAFSEACYEEPYPMVDECKFCPYRQDNHPTFKPPMNKFSTPGVNPKKGGGGKRKFHTCARDYVTLRFGTTGNNFKEEDEHSKQLYDELNAAIFAQKTARRDKPIVTKLSPIRADLDAEMCEHLLLMKKYAQNITPISSDLTRCLLMGKRRKNHQIGDPRRHKMRKPKKEKCGKCRKLPYKPQKEYDIKKKTRKWRESSRRRSTSTCHDCAAQKVEGAVLASAQATEAGAAAPAVGGSGVETGMLCKMKKIPQIPGKETEKCEQREPSLVCPKNLLDRKPYPKLRKAIQKQKDEQAKRDKKRHDRAKKSGTVRSPKKKAAGIEEGGVRIDEPFLNRAAIISDSTGLNQMNDVVPTMWYNISLFQKKPRAVRPSSFIKREKAYIEAMSPRTVIPTQMQECKKFEYKPLPPELATEKVRFFVDRLEEERMRVRQEIEQDRLQQSIDTLNNMIIAKDRVRVTGPARCPDKCDTKRWNKKKCPKKIKSRVCPTDMLDRKPYKKYREGVKNRRKKDKKRHKKHHKKHHKKGKKHRKHKKHGGHRLQESEGAMEAIGEEVAAEEMTARLMDADATSPSSFMGEVQAPQQPRV